MDLIITLIGDLLYGLMWGAILLIVSVFLLPNRIFNVILRKLKPDFVSKDVFMKRLRLVFDYFFNSKEVIIADEKLGAHKVLLEEISSLMCEKRLLEGNLFFLDLLKNLSNILYFSVTNAGHDQSAAYAILDQSMNYLQHYARQLKASCNSQNIERRVNLAADQLRTQVADMTQFLKTAKSKDMLDIARLTMQQQTGRFDEFMKGEYESTRENLIRTNQLLAEKLILFIGDADTCA